MTLVDKQPLEILSDWKKRLLFSGVILALLVWGIFHNRSKDIVHFQGQTMGTTYQVSYLSANSIHDVDYLQEAVEDTLFQISNSMSTYIDDSEISRFNQLGVDEWFPISMAMLEVVSQALNIARESNGYFDPTVGPLVSLWRLDQSHFESFEPPTQSAVEATKKSVGFQYVLLDSPAQKIKKTKPVHLDLSAIAKGYAVDMVAKQLDNFGVSNFLIEIGGEVYAKGTKSSNKPWRIAIETPDLLSRQVNHVIELNDLAVASSGDYRNYVRYQDQIFGHIINPISGYPVKHQLYSVTVIHSSTMIADAWATALSVLGPEKGLQLANQLDLAVLFLILEKETIKQYWSQKYAPFLVLAQ